MGWIAPCRTWLLLALRGAILFSSIYCFLQWRSEWELHLCWWNWLLLNALSSLDNRLGFEYLSSQVEVLDVLLRLLCHFLLIFTFTFTLALNDPLDLHFYSLSVQVLSPVLSYDKLWLSECVSLHSVKEFEILSQLLPVHDHKVLTEDNITFHKPLDK